MGQVALSQCWACSARGICHGLHDGMGVGQMGHSKGASENRVLGEGKRGRKSAK